MAVRWPLQVTAAAVSSSLNAKGRDSLHEVDVPRPDRVRVCTRPRLWHVKAYAAAASQMESVFFGKQF